MMGNRWSISATWVKTTVRQTKLNNSNKRPTITAGGFGSLTLSNAENSVWPRPWGWGA
jgi:hypothetical protein